MKKCSLLLLLVCMSFSLIGCTTGSSGGGMGSGIPGEVALRPTDLAVVEASLLANRVEVLENAPLPNAAFVVLPGQTTETGSTFQHRGRQFRGGKMGNGRNAQRGAGRCQVTLDGSIASATRLWVASEACTIEQTDTGGYRIVRANGSEITVEKPADGTNRTTLTVNGQTWAALFGDGASAPLVTLKNDLSGRTLIINEDDAGNLTITPEGGVNVRGFWNSDGSIEATEDGCGRQYRYRGGRNA